MMFDPGCDDMLSLCSISFRSCNKRPVIGLRPSRRKIYFRPICVKALCNDVSRIRDRLFALCAKLINAAGISILLCKIREHCVKRLFCTLGSGCIVQIYHMIHLIVTPFPFLKYSYRPSYSYQITRFCKSTIALPSCSVNPCPRIYFYKLPPERGLCLLEAALFAYAVHLPWTL